MKTAITHHDVIVLGAGAAGLMCAIEAGKRGRRVLLLDHAHAPGEKIRISGGGRCNFTNLHTAPANFLSENPRFCISALKSYTQHDFIALVKKHAIAYHEKTLGQLFCDNSSRQIVDMLLKECREAGVTLRLQTKIASLEKTEAGFSLGTGQDTLTASSLVVATGGKSIPKMGATGLGYEIARRFGIEVVTPRPALVPLTFNEAQMHRIAGLAGVSAPVRISCGKAHFDEALLFTHRGLSGPAILQISSFWREGEEISIDFTPCTDVFAFLRAARKNHPRQDAATALSRLLPRRLAERILENSGSEAHDGESRLADMADHRLKTIASSVNDWRIIPGGTEGFRTAEVTAGGVDTRALSSKTFEARAVPGLYFIGEVVDVTGHLGGFNFQWAWSSGHAAGCHI